jgi:SagB-type dehydrogenase family enzyme
MMMAGTTNAAEGIEQIAAYHQRSKHQLHRYAPGPGGLDWANQPDPFRVFAQAPRVQLPLVADSLTVSYAAVSRGRYVAPRPINLDAVGALFELALGISAWKSYGGARWALRCNPSSGNLHPTEGYLACGELPDLKAGVYHYASRDHQLERRALGTPAWASALPQGGLVVGLTSIHWREAWKYGMRAWRYCQHDCGHAIAAVAFAAACLGWRTQILGEWSDADIAALLGLDREADFFMAEREEPDVLLWVGRDGAIPEPGRLLALARDAQWLGRANRLSHDQVEWRDIDQAAAAAVKPCSPTETPGATADLPPLCDPRLDLPAATVIRQRRSAVDFDGVTTISAATFYTMLDALLARPRLAPWNAWAAAPRVHPALFVHRVAGLAPGLYLLARSEAALETLKRSLRREWLWQRPPDCPGHIPLYLLLPYDLREAARVVSCHQDIAADSCFALGFLAEFEAPLSAGAWVYRRLFWETGVLGQVLYLEAEAAGVRATGIGCFFDDEMHELLGLEGTAFQSLYHFTVGGAVDDPRLTTHPPYAHLGIRRTSVRQIP